MAVLLSSGGVVLAQYWRNRGDQSRRRDTASGAHGTHHHLNLMKRSGAVFKMAWWGPAKITRTIARPM